VDGLDEMRTAAAALANTGLYRNCSAIEHELIGLGFSKAHDALKNPEVRAIINRACYTARNAAAGIQEVKSK
jgi:hypothetical protein